jgi:hypothetical protein
LKGEKGKVKFISVPLGTRHHHRFHNLRYIHFGIWEWARNEAKDTRLYGAQN